MNQEDESPDKLGCSKIHRFFLISGICACAEMKYFEQVASVTYVTTFQIIRQSFSKIFEQFMNYTQFMKKFCRPFRINLPEIPY